VLALVFIEIVLVFFLVPLGTAPNRQTVISISTDIGVLYLGISCSLGKVHSISKIVSNTAVGNGQLIGIFHFIRFHIVSYPYSALKMLKPEVMQLGILSTEISSSPTASSGMVKSNVS